MTPTHLQINFKIHPEYYTPNCLREMPISEGCLYLNIDIKTGQIDNFWSAKAFDIAQPIESADFYLFENDDLCGESIGADLLEILQFAHVNEQGLIILPIDADGFLCGWSDVSINLDELGV